MWYLILGPGADPELVCDELDDFWLVEEDGLVQRGGAVLVARQREALGRQQLGHDGYDPGGRRVVQDGDRVLRRKSAT